MANKDTINNSNQSEVWNGVSIEELRFMRASALIRLEMQKEYLKRKTAETLPSNMVGKKGVVNGIAGKMNFVQKAILVIKGVRLANNIISLFRKK